MKVIESDVSDSGEGVYYSGGQLGKVNGFKRKIKAAFSGDTDHAASTDSMKHPC